jgi:ribonuclease T2
MLPLSITHLMLDALTFLLILCLMTKSVRCFGLTSLALVFLLMSSARVLAQKKGEPGKFDFYLLNLSWSPEFCSIQGTSPQCAARPGFVVHGLWPQNNDGSYPVFCSHRRGPKHPEVNLDITPDPSLLEHEWSKHGTCTTLPPDEFFAAEHRAFHSLKIPEFFETLDHEVLLKPMEILGMFAKANPAFPEGSIVLSCGNNRLTAIEACLAKDDLRPIACQGLRGCRAQVVRITPATQR